jgi:H3 lysine-79-specific histone-lysine N-methyltransferase
LPLDLDPFEPGPCNPLKEAVKGWTLSGLPEQVMLRIVDETYQRCVGPHVRELGRYEAFSSSVYGELMPSLISDIVTATALSPSSLLLDLGSGVGNVVTQASLQSGCTSFGVELMPVPAKVSLKQLEEFKRRCRMWGVSIGDVHLEEGDMLTSRKVSELMGKADVVLVNNKVFREERKFLFPRFSHYCMKIDFRGIFEVNEALRPKFLDLKEGAVVVSLKPFVSSLNARVTERNVCVFPNGMSRRSI